MKWLGTNSRIRPMTALAMIAAAALLLVTHGALRDNTAAFAQQLAPDPLAKVEADVDRDYAGVAHMTAGRLAALRAAGKPLLVFDVRESGEFGVSRIANAVRVDPGVWTSSFLRANRGRVKGRTVVFYCSVGVRSSKLARRVQQQLMAAGAAGVFNLRGGVFRWHNDARPLIDAKGGTSFVHPYDKYWGRLLNRKSLARYKPGSGG